MRSASSSVMGWLTHGSVWCPVARQNVMVGTVWLLWSASSFVAVNQRERKGSKHPSEPPTQRTLSRLYLPILTQLVSVHILDT